MLDLAGERVASGQTVQSMTAIIEAKNAGTTFLQYRRKSGFAGTLKTLLHRDYDEVHAVADVSFGIRSGEAIGYLGPNGAGKSTMIKMMTGILVPTAGAITVLGRNPHERRRENAAEIGVVFGQRSQLWWDLPVIDSFVLHREIYRIPPERYRRNLDEFAALLQLSAFLDRPVRQLSLGQRMRCEIVMALLHDPKILFLDEPTIGLDVVAKDVVRKFLARINAERGVTIILTTHDMQDIERICPRLIMVDEGRLLFDGPLSEVRAAFGAQRLLTLEFADDPGPVRIAGARLEADEGARKTYRLDGLRSLVEIIGSIPAGLGLRDAAIAEPGIEEIVRGYFSQRPER
jgi:ABC-2 type transport system ATP-binding protein